LFVEVGKPIVKFMWNLKESQVKMGSNSSLH
jgi:hypothetical protein